jgi:hypothetical protein
MCLDIGRDDPTAVGDGADRGKSGGLLCHALNRLQRIPRGDEQPHLMETQTPARKFRHMPVPLMRRIEGSAEQADPGPASVAVNRDRRLLAQGRTWPVPVTT